MDGKLGFGIADDVYQHRFNDLTRTIAKLIGVDVQVNTTGFSNNLITFKGKDDVLPLLIHLGCLAYDSLNALSTFLMRK